MKTAVIRSSWMEGYGYRLDCSPYLGGALETKILLEKLPLRKDKLHTLTKGFDGGIYNGPQFVRNYVDSAEHGVAFITGSSMQLADLSNLPRLSERDARSPRLRHLELQTGMSLISCSGSIGKMAYARREMKGLWSSQDVLKVVADPDKIASGYLYAYLSSKFGVPLLVSGTYGSIIQHLEARQITDLPVPRLGDAFEHEIHILIEEAAELRSRASDVLQATLVEFEREAGLPPTAELRCAALPLYVSVSSAKLFGRLDPGFHSPRHYSVLRPFDHEKVKAVTVGQLASRVFEPTRCKRVKHDNPRHSVPLFGVGAIGDIDPEPSSRITAFPGCEHDTVGALVVLIPRSGQLNGIMGTATLPIGGVRSGVVSEHLIQVHCRNEAETGYLFLALRSETGRAQLKARAFVGSTLTLDVKNSASVLVPELTATTRERFGTMAFQVAELRTEAIEKERLAREKVVNALDGAGCGEIGSTCG